MQPIPSEVSGSGAARRGRDEPRYITAVGAPLPHSPATVDTDMAKVAIFSVAVLLLLALSRAAPAEKPAEKEDLEAPAEKEDLKTAASHWGGWGGGYGGHWGGYGHWGSPYYGSYSYGWPSYGYGYGYGWPYGGYGGWGGWGGYGGHGYWW